jgi:AraC-like DNA-binding protein
MQSENALLPLDPGLFGQPPAQRVMRLDGHWRFCICAFKAHGRRPEDFVDSSLVSYGGNLVLRGRGRYTAPDGRDLALAPGVFFQRLPGVRHTTRIDPESDYAEFYLTLEAQTAQQLLGLKLLERGETYDVGLDQLLLGRCIEMHDLVRAHDPALTDSVFLLRVLDFLHTLYVRGRRAPDVPGEEAAIRQAAAYLHQHQNARPALETLAHDVGLNYATFRRKFREVMGLSPRAYQIRCRLEQACGMLGSHSVKQVAHLLGYPDPFTFSAQFKTHVGVAPRDFQRRLRAR